MSIQHDEILAIQQLKARYFRFMDTRDWASWRTVFTDDVVVRVDLTAPSEDAPAITSAYPEGGDAFVEAMSSYFIREKPVTMHHGHMPEITLTGPDTAKGIWSMEDRVRWPNGREMQGFGHYHEDYRKVDGAWRIARLTLTRIRVDNHGDWSQAAGEKVPFVIV